MLFNCSVVGIVPLEIVPLGMTQVRSPHDEELLVVSQRRIHPSLRAKMAIAASVSPCIIDR
jgi:hypothetical protein